MDPIIFIVWTCAVIFAATGVITLLAIIKLITIETRFLNKLFVALILEIVAVTIGFGYTGFFNADKNTTKGIEISTNIQFVDSNELSINSISEKDFKEQLEIKTTPDHSVKTLNGIVFMVYAKENFPKITFTYRGFESQMIDLSKYSDSLKGNKIDIGTIKLKKVNQNYNPSNFESENTDILPEFFEGPPVITESDED